MNYNKTSVTSSMSSYVERGRLLLWGACLVVVALCREERKAARLHIQPDRGVSSR